MATHSSVLAWRISGTEEPGGLPSIGSHRVGHDWRVLAAILHCVYVPLLSCPFICWWTSRLLPCPDYCKQSWDEHWGTRVSFDSGFLSVYVQKWDCWVPSLHSRDKSNLSLCIILLMCSWIWLTIILCICIHQGYWSIIFPCTILIWLWYQSNAGLVEWVWRYSLLFNCSEVFKKNWH